MFSWKLHCYSAHFTRTWPIVFVMVVSEWVGNTHSLKRENSQPNYKKEQYGFELSQDRQTYGFEVGGKNRLFDLLKSWL